MAVVNAQPAAFPEDWSTDTGWEPYRPPTGSERVAVWPFADRVLQAEMEDADVRMNLAKTLSEQTGSPWNANRLSRVLGLKASYTTDGKKVFRTWVTLNTAMRLAEALNMAPNEVKACEWGPGL